MLPYSHVRIFISTADRKDLTEIVYIDFKTAFEKISHLKLIEV